MQFLKSIVGRKIVMAISGLMMVLFVVAHLLGNSSIFAGPGGINAYAMKLHEFGPVVWIYRLVMVLLLSLHVYYGVQLTLENNKAKPQGYAVKKNLSATFAGRNMVWTGLILGTFLVYHLLHFTIQITNPAISAGSNMDAAGRPDVFHMVVLSFQRSFIVSIYIVAMIALAFHLAHGIQSFFQTLGMNNDRTFPVIIRSGTFAAVIIFLGYIAIPIIILVGILKG